MVFVSAKAGDVTWHDNFAEGFRVGKSGSEAKWNLLEAEDFYPNDGIVTVGENGLNVIPKGVHPISGEPAFTQTLAPASPEAAIPGVLDHIKWVTFVNAHSSKGFSGFDTPPGTKLYVESLVNGRTYGTASHPFGDAVLDAESDFRLGTFAMLTMDIEANFVFAFFLTSTTIFAMYERPPFARDTLGNYASFSFAVPVGSRAADDWHKLAVSYDRDTNTVCWFVDGQCVQEVDRIGRRLDRRYMVIDVGGDSEEPVQLNQLGCGLGLYTLMDASLNGGPGLVDLYGYPMFYSTTAGAPTPLQYVDSESLETSRIFGQGARLQCRNFSVSYR